MIRHSGFNKKVLALVCCVVLCFTMVQPPKAKAFAPAVAIPVIAAAFLSSCGLTWTVTHQSDDSFKDAVSDLLAQYCTAKNFGTVVEWAGDLTLVLKGNKLLLPKLFASKLAGFASWLIEQKGITAGGSDVTIVAGVSSLLCADGTYFKLGSYHPSSLVWESYGTTLEIGTNLILQSGAKFIWSGNSLCFYSADGTFKSTECRFISSDTQHERAVIFPGIQDNCFSVFKQVVDDSDGKLYQPYFYWQDMKNVPLSELGESISSVGGIALSPAKAIDVPDTSTMRNDQSLAIDTGLTATTTDDILQKILDAILAGDLTATASVSDTDVATGVTDVDNLDLPSIATVITEKFPFSIPWDIARGIKLLAAPSKAPCWSVDFMAAIQHRVGTWDGDTTVKLDMANYPLVGQICRWTSTIGFCLLLAAATKKLSWIGG